MSAALVIIDERPQQDCGRCRSMHQCWAKSLSPAAISVNLLVCRILRGIDRERSTRALLELIHPKIRRVARRLATITRSPVKDLIQEVQSVVVERLLTTYAMGMKQHPLRWLFGQNGCITYWGHKRIELHQLELRKFQHYDHSPAEIDERIFRANYVSTNGAITTGPPNAYQEPVYFDEHASERERARNVLAVLNDGITLTASEYRVLAYCFRNSSNRPHAKLARRMGVGRQVVTNTYGNALRTLLFRSGEGRAYLSTKNLSPRRYAGFISADEIIQLLELKRRASTKDLALVYGVSEYCIRNVITRFGRLTPEEVRKTCAES